MNKYHNGKIYKIVDVDHNKQYIGSTTETLSRRMAHHKHQYKMFNQGLRTKVCSFDLFDEFGIDNCKIELIEYFNCETKDEQLKREGEHKKNNECLNRFIAGRTNKEYYIDNGDYIKSYRKQYREDNLDKLKKKAKDYRQENADKIKQSRQEYYKENKEKVLSRNAEYQNKHKDRLDEYRRDYREKHKGEKKLYGEIYRKNNKEYLNNQCKDWYDKYKDEIAERRKIKCECPCGSIVRKCDLRDHERTNKHQEYLKTLENQLINNVISNNNIYQNKLGLQQ